MTDNITTFCNGIIPFVWDRLQLDKHASIEGRAPCLEEDWFVEDALACGSPFAWRGRAPEESHRLLYRYARNESHLRGQIGGEPHWLLLHQMAGLVPALFTEAQDVFLCQAGKEKL